MQRLITQVGYPLVGVVLLIAAWVVLCWAANLPTVVLPTPDKVLDAFIKRFDLLMSEGWVTLKETLYGFVLAVVVGIPIAIANSRALNLTFYPLLIGLQSVPKVAVAPILLVWLGSGIESKLARYRLAGCLLSDHCRHDRGSTFDTARTPGTGAQFARDTDSDFPESTVSRRTALRHYRCKSRYHARRHRRRRVKREAWLPAAQCYLPARYAARLRGMFALSFMGVFVYLLVELAERLAAPSLPPSSQRH